MQAGRGPETASVSLVVQAAASWALLVPLLLPALFTFELGSPGCFEKLSLVSTLNSNSGLRYVLYHPAKRQGLDEFVSELC